MAKINDKNISDLSDWSLKELRKLRINVNNRITALESFRNKKAELKENHLLYGLELGECKKLIEDIKRAEKALVY